MTVTGRGSGTINLFGDDHDGVRKLAVRPGTASIGVSKKVVGDKLYGMAEYLREIAKPVRGVVIGHVGGEIVVNDDDPQPKVTVVPIAGKVVEGKPLTYRVTLSTKAETAIYTYAIVQPPAAGHELSTIDVDPAWIAEHTESGQALPDRPLSDPTSETRLYTAVEPGKLTADLTVPTVTDDRVEGTENFEAKLFVIPRGGLTDTSGPVFTGTVSDPA